MRLLISLLFLLAIAFASYYFLIGYRSAFEADQACHSEKWNFYGDNVSYGCDHDLETNQWILYEQLPDHNPARIIKRFRY